MHAPFCVHLCCVAHLDQPMLNHFDVGTRIWVMILHLEKLQDCSIADNLVRVVGSALQASCDALYCATGSTARLVCCVLQHNAAGGKGTHFMLPKRRFGRRNKVNADFRLTFQWFVLSDAMIFCNKSVSKRRSGMFGRPSKIFVWGAGQHATTESSTR